MKDRDQAKREFLSAVEKLKKLGPGYAAAFEPSKRAILRGEGLVAGSTHEAQDREQPQPKAPAAPSKARGLGRVYRRGRVWWIQYSFRGEVYRESSGSSNRVDAVKLLRRRLEEMGRGRLIGPDVERTTFQDLAQMLLNDYRANGKRSLPRIEDAVNHLGDTFAKARALEITTDRIIAYSAARQEAGAANATINRELSALRRMFRLGEQAGKVAHRPHIPMLQEDNVRKGFFEPEQFEAVLPHFSEDLKPVLTTAYLTGWRATSEILTRHWPHVDFRGGWLRLEPGQTKNKKGRQFPLIPELRAILERQRERTLALERATGQIISWVFHRSGKPIKDFRDAWERACRKAGLVGKLPHDFRRSAVRNLERAGVSRSTAMEMVGHKTESVYRRYAIVAEADLREGGQKLAALHHTEAGKPRSVIPLDEARRERTSTSLAQPGG